MSLPGPLHHSPLGRSLYWSAARSLPPEPVPLAEAWAALVAAWSDYTRPVVAYLGDVVDGFACLMSGLFGPRD